MTRLPNLECQIDHHPTFLTRTEADALLAWFLDHVVWFDHRIVFADGRETTVPTGKCLFVDDDALDAPRLTGAGKRVTWPTALIDCKRRVEALVGRPFAVGVGLHYPDGRVGVDYHADYRAFGDLSYIPSLSVGAPRMFSLRRTEAPNEVLNLELGHGSLVVMGPGCQERYEHAILCNETVTEPRFNVTFRDLER